MSKFNKESKKNVLDSTVMEYIMQIFNQTIKKLQLAITVPILVQNSVLYPLLTPEEMDLVANVFSSKKSTLFLHTNKIYSKTQSYLSNSEMRQNLNKSSAIESECDTNNEVEIFDAAVFKMLKVLYSYSSIHKMTELYQKNISTQSSLFKHHFNYFMEYVISVMRTTPEEENVRNMHYKNIWYGHKNALKEIKELTESLEALRKSKEKEMESVITQYKTDTMIMDSLNRKCVEDLHNVSNKYERKQLMLHKNWETKREELCVSLDKIKIDLGILKSRNLSATLELDNKRVKTEAQLLSIINKFDTDMDERQTEFDELTETYQSDSMEKDSLKTEIKLQESTYNFFLNEHQNTSQTYIDESSEYIGVECCLARKKSSFSLLKYFISPPGSAPKKVKSVSELIGDDVVLDFTGLVQRHGYPAEEHSITTDDGYILTFHRIPNSPLSDTSKKKPVVFVQHGMTASSDTWVMFGPKKDLPFILADAGYDVWLGNFRGNTYCRSHARLTTDDPIFWQFSYHDVGMHDTPAYIDYVLNYTDSNKLFYIGHSMGTSVSYVMLSMKPSYNDKMRLVISLAPVSYFKHKFTPALQRVLDNVPQFKKILSSNGIYDVVPQSKIYKKLAKSACTDKSIFQPICESIYFMISGRDKAQLNSTALSYIMNYVPAGISTQSLLHYYQNIMTGEFKAYDYGYEDNMAHYKQSKPPVYDVGKITAPVALIYGINDVLTNEEDARELYKRLPNVAAFEPVPYECFSHLDFIVGNDAKSLVYDRILNLMKEF
ncbi:hypothetical protein KPH14_001769 [Odynerus spinipes]|uniref:Partial AB-hydrolase lipase domain-containing protein n=1 Tax=Odynerus spinipes TaxID=1348599 RepID=A0AAD9RZP5_9HYME|nr:hypothetical protein KPH14_001769 [Odynerus spinipes]